MIAMKAFITIVAVVLLAFVGIGFALSSEWSAERTRRVEATPEEVFAYVGDLSRWDGWSSIAQVEGELQGDPAAPGATYSWDDRNWGEGQLRLTEVVPGRAVAYEVGVEGGSIRTSGRITVQPRGAGSEITWSESGDLGWNPLLSYFALGMDRMQGEELEKGLDRLQALLEGRELPEVPTTAGPTGPR